ncbi:SRPBCC domain-containing protein [Cellulosimicrobium sp. NPDC057862]|uniref:SRPBCC domain-containing protein n=1 Tax=Cellulosimicrobium sp. NPDC057862 TaxID=3346266 RepID=UPI0036732D7A
MAAVTAPLVKTLDVPAPPEHAFAVFVDELAAWWPLGAFSVGGETSTAAFERDADGRAVRLVETLADGTTADWGRVTRWDPPHAVAFTWHPGERADAATDVEVTFSPAGEGSDVVLTHSGWSARHDGAGARARYDDGWDLVLAPFAERAGASR